MLSTFNRFFRRSKNLPQKFTTGEYRCCPRCKKEFWITSIERAFYREQAVALPNLCRLCLKDVQVEKALQQEPTIFDRAANS